MTWATRSFALAAGAAAMLSAQAAYAAPVRTQPAVDPLVSLSLLGTTQSRAAVCGTVTTCSLPTSMATTAASPVLPAAASAAAMQGDRERRGVNPLLLGLGLAIFIAIIVAIASGKGSGRGDLTPISPQ